MYPYLITKHTVGITLDNHHYTIKDTSTYYNDILEGIDSGDSNKVRTSVYRALWEAKEESGVLDKISIDFSKELGYKESILNLGYHRPLYTND